MNKREYRQANKDWLEAKAKEDGVNALSKGVYYKVISEGKNDGRHPTPRSVVTAHYTGWTIDGKKFDSSLGGIPMAFRLERADRGVDYRDTADVHRGQMGSLYSRRTWIRQILTTWHSRRLNTDIRN